MKKLQDLKAELLAKQVNPFYVFYGEEYGIRKHYINYIEKLLHTKAEYISSLEEYDKSTRQKALWDIGSELVVIYNDIDFTTTVTVPFMVDFVARMSKRGTCILVFETENNSIFFNDFDQYTTYFPIVAPNIAKEFVLSELKLSDKQVTTMANDCRYTYGSIKSEADKIKCYANELGMSIQNAYESLETQDQLLQVLPEFDVVDFMNDTLLGETSNLAYWYIVIRNSPEKFIQGLYNIFNDFLIAGVIKQFGKFPGSNKAYNDYKLNWGRIKVIREFELFWPADKYFESAYRVAEMQEKLHTGEITTDNVIDYYLTHL